MEFVQRINMIPFAALAVAAGIMLLYSTVMAVEKKQTPINIEADRMVSHEKQNAVIFSGNVDAKQGELLIRTDKMTVFYEQQEDKKEGAGSSEVKKLVCEGNVQISQGDWLGTGQRMDYYALERKAVLTGDAKAWQGQNMVSGKTITYFIDEGRSIVSTDDKKVKDKPGRVKAVIQPDAKKK